MKPFLPDFSNNLFAKNYRDLFLKHLNELNQLEKESGMDLPMLETISGNGFSADNANTAVDLRHIGQDLKKALDKYVSTREKE
ncbi:MAG: hypothetical protein V4543_17610 [Bacteroidota bacterium]